MAIGETTITGSWELHKNVHIAHGSVASVAAVVWFPLGVFLLRSLRLDNTVRFHALWQAIGLLLLVVGFGLGSWLSKIQGGLYDQGHVILGIVITILFLLMPVFGWLHHRHFATKGAKSYKRHIHVWGGRILLVLGIINGGMGLKLADNTTSGGIAYGIVGGLITLTYGGVWYWSKRQARSESDKTETRGDNIEMNAAFKGCASHV